MTKDSTFQVVIDDIADAISALKEMMPRIRIGYKIHHLEERGVYVATRWGSMIDDDGSTGVGWGLRYFHYSSSRYGCDTKEEAGSRINLHHEMHGGSKVVWRG